MKVIVFFIGLFAHMYVTPDGETAHTVAVAAAAKEHASWVAVLHKNGSEDVLKIDGLLVTITGGGTSRPVRKLGPSVPSLPEVTGCLDATDNVRNLRKDGAVLSYVDVMTAGVLDGSARHARKMFFKNPRPHSQWETSQCASCGVEFDGEDDKPLKLHFVKIGGAASGLADIQANPGDVVYFYNLSLDSNHAGAADFRALYKLLDGCTSKATPEDDTQHVCGPKYCGAPVIVPKPIIPARTEKKPGHGHRPSGTIDILVVNPSVGCTNSQWP